MSVIAPFNYSVLRNHYYISVYLYKEFKGFMVKTLPIYQIYLRSQILDIIFIFKEIDILAINIQPS